MYIVGMRFGLAGAKGYACARNILYILNILICAEFLCVAVVRPHCRKDMFNCYVNEDIIGEYICLQ